MQIVIEKDIPLPKRVTKPRAEKYPLSKLTVGESFYAAVKAPALAAQARKVSAETERKFVVRAEGDGARVWRKV